MSFPQDRKRRTRRPRRRSVIRLKRYVLPCVFTLVVVAVYFLNSKTDVDPGLSFAGPLRSVHSLQFLRDESWLDEANQRHVDQTIFDHALTMIRDARSIILLDMFLFNSFQGPEPETTRIISKEITDALIAQKKLYPAMKIIIISDPINTVYGGIESPHFNAMKDNGIEVILTDLTELRDSNPVYSLIWRYLIKPFGNSLGDTLPNPFGSGRVTIRSYLRMINFKANHRKILLTDVLSRTYAVLVTSANPHDGSSAHRNTAVSFSGPAAQDVVQSENAVLALSDQAPVQLQEFGSFDTEVLEGVSVQILTERKIKEKILELLAEVEPGESVDLLIFYLSDRDIVRALGDAAERGVVVRVLLDVNSDAFGHEKNGVPNKPVASELVRRGVKVRWCNTQGEQCHAKMLLVKNGDTVNLLQGSANFTRRNLENYNLESNVYVVGASSTHAIIDAKYHFDTMWSNQPKKLYSVAYEVHADESLMKRWLYRVMETTGLSTF